MNAIGDVWGTKTVRFESLIAHKPSRYPKNMLILRPTQTVFGVINLGLS